MTNTICAGRGGVPIPRLSEPLPDEQGVNGKETIGTSELLGLKQPPDAQTGAQEQSPLLIDAAQAHWWLDLLGKDEQATWIRAIPHKGKAGRAINGNFARDLEQAQHWQAHGSGIYGVVNNGGHRGNQINEAIALFVEWDDRPRDEQVGLWEDLSLPQPTFQVDTGGKSIHNYWRLTTPVSVETWSAVLERLIKHCGSDPACKGAPRVMRLPGSHYINRDGDSCGLATIINPHGATYSMELFDDLLPKPPRPNQRRIKRNLETIPLSLQEIAEALQCIPARKAGSNTYEAYRNILWGLIAAVEDAGYDQQVAIELMEGHSPSNSSGWNVRQVARSGGIAINAGTFFHHAKQHGWNRHGTF